jgi:hypothetical protein
MFDGQDSPFVKELALLSLQALAHQICKSFYERHVSTEVLAPEDKQPWMIDPRTGRPIMPYGMNQYPTENFSLPQKAKGKIQTPQIEEVGEDASQ